ncbi:hypothetical protein BVG16_07240 [Paenibacillus selenitireducens]|uniref:Lipoprotein n=1 Tax=Paenibacillus selenitireducens TaxID=1324314 RepID=A0A1T2XLH4_9BACL|nr:hypothetical protein [Paenibacillus selenitireducens]OPA80513.1 hypothetical protein BVG16_07240 [Paenibacillus selenitireducens]
MRTIIILLFCAIITIGCNKQKIDFDEVTNSLNKAEKTMNSKDRIVRIEASPNNETINFRIMVEDRITNEQAKTLVSVFLNEIEKGIQNKDLLRKSYLIKFDIISQKDGAILYKGQRNKGVEEIWWQF